MYGCLTLGAVSQDISSLESVLRQPAHCMGYFLFVLINLEKTNKTETQYKLETSGKRTPQLGKYFCQGGPLG